MLADWLSYLWPYQIFRSVFFRGGMAFLCTYLFIMWVMPWVIHHFRAWGVTSDFGKRQVQTALPYRGPKPSMGGGVLIVAILFSALLWVQWNQFIVALTVIMVAFGLIGAWDDLAKVRARRRVEAGSLEAKDYADKADGISGKMRLGLEFVVATVVVVGLYRYVNVDGHLVVPFIPLKWWYPYLPRYVFIPFMVIIIVAGANAVNLTDGMDSLATVPLLTCTLFVASVAYVGADPEWVGRLGLPLLSPELRELIVFAAALLSAGLAFLRFNAPPAMITMGDMGALALGSVFSAMFIFAKVQLFLPLVGGVFVLTTLSSIVQRVFFKVMLWRHGREAAKATRFFYKAPYHHHLQELWQYKADKKPRISVWVEMLKKVGIHPPEVIDQLENQENIDNRVIWRMHTISLLLFVLGLIVYFKVR